MKNRYFQNELGFSLVELIASMVIAGILAMALLTLVVTAINGYFFSKDSIEISQKAQLALARMRKELVDLKSITTASADKIIFTNDSGTYEIERSNGSITLKKNSSPAIAAKTLVDNIAIGYGGELFLTYGRMPSGNWTIVDDISDLFSITILLKFNSHNSVFTLAINPRLNSLRNAPRLI